MRALLYAALGLLLAAALCRAQAPSFAIGFSSDPVFNSSTAGYLLGNNVVQTPVPRTLLGKLEDWVSVNDYGAVGDCVANDTVAVQAAFDALRSGGVITLTGCYAVGALTFNVTNGTILGVGGILSSLIPQPASTPSTQPPTLLSILSAGAVVRGVRFVNPTGANDTAAIWMKGSVGIPAAFGRIDGNSIDGFAHAIDVGQGLNLPIVYAWAVTVTGNFVTNVKGPAISNNLWGDCVHLWCYGCTVSGNECAAKIGGNARTGGSADNQGTSYGSVGSNVFQGNVIYGGFGRGFDVEAGGCSILGNRIIDATTWYIYSQGQSVIVGNHISAFTLSASRGIYVTSSNEVTISSNSITSGGTAVITEGIDLESTDIPTVNYDIGSSVTGNRISGALARCFRVRGATTYAVFSANTCYLNYTSASPLAGAFIDTGGSNIVFAQNIFNISTGGYGIYLASSASVVTATGNQYFGGCTPTYQLNYVVPPVGTIGTGQMYQVSGYDSNIDAGYLTKGGGVWQYGYNVTACATCTAPATYAGSLKVRIGNTWPGTLYYIPLLSSPLP